MKTLALILSLTLCVSAFASSGTTYCPTTQDFHYDKASGQMVAPGGWALGLGEPFQVKSFVKVEAAGYNGQILDCVYNIVVDGSPYQIPITADDYQYIADDISSPIWHQGSISKICSNTNPKQCPFHQATNR